MPQFVSNTEAKVDIKGRIFVPAIYRKSLESENEGTLYLKIDTIRKCAKLYPKSAWDKLDTDLRSVLNLWDNEDMRLYRQFTSQVECIELDSVGRALIQRRHLDVLGIGTDAILIGAGNYFEIWSKEIYNKSLYDEYDFDEKIQKKMGNKQTS